jgi:hypothetical protein
MTSKVKGKGERKGKEKATQSDARRTNSIHLGGEVADFAALDAVVLAVLHQAHVVGAHADAAVLVAETLLFGKFTDRTHESGGHN